MKGVYYDSSRLSEGSWYASATRSTLAHFCPSLKYHIEYLRYAEWVKKGRPGSGAALVSGEKSAPAPKLGK